MAAFSTEVALGHTVTGDISPKSFQDAAYNWIWHKGTTGATGRRDPKGTSLTKEVKTVKVPISGPPEPGLNEQRVLSVLLCFRMKSKLVLHSVLVVSDGPTSLAPRD